MKLDQAGLYEIVERYAAFGSHHTGTAVDRETTAWLLDLLSQLGGQVDADEYQFERFVCEASMAVGEVDGPTLPLFYSHVGQVTTTRFDLVKVDAANVGNAHTLNAILPQGDERSMLVVAIDGPDDLVVQANRVPTEMLGRPAVVIPGNWADRVRAGASVDFRAELVPGTSANVVATFGDPAAPPVMITTPLTGWTPAAGERGTGLAAAIAIAADLATDHRVTFSACSGHEIDHLGLRHYLAPRDLRGATAIHLGASVAACEKSADGSLTLGDRRMVLSTASGSTRSEIGEIAATANWSMPALEPPWPGEGGTWLEAGARVLSFLGGATLFHTLDDVAVKATTPEAVQRATTAALGATRTFLKGIA